MDIKNVVFDVGGVFVKWEPRAVFGKFIAAEKIESFMEEIGFKEINERGDLGESVGEMMEQKAKEFPQYEKALRAYNERWLDSIIYEYDGTRNLAHALKDNGYKIYILSNWEADKFQILESKYKLLEFFDGAVISGEVGLIKPKPEIYNLLLKKYCLKAEECVFFDDVEANVKGAKNVGFEGFVWTNAQQGRLDLKTLGVKI
jgi:2-haloacid dehalogenase